MNMLLSVIRRETRETAGSNTGLACMGVLSAAVGACIYQMLGIAGTGEIADTAGRLFSRALFPVYHLFAIIFPTVVTQSLFRDSGYGSLRYLGQVCGPGRLFAGKLAGAMFYLAAGMMLSLPAVFYWTMLGGNVGPGEIALLYVGVVIGGACGCAVSFAISSFSKGWHWAAGVSVLVMAGCTYPGLLAGMLGILPGKELPSLAKLMEPLENGLLPVGPAAVAVTAIIGLLLLSLCLYARGRSGRARVYAGCAIAGMVIVACLSVAGLAGILDATVQAGTGGWNGEQGPGQQWGSPALMQGFDPGTGAAAGRTGEHGQPAVSDRDRRDILVLYWGVIPLLLLLAGAIRTIDSGRMPAGRKKTVVMAGTWITLMVSLALLQDHYFKNGTLNIFPSVREILPDWAGSAMGAATPAREDGPGKDPVSPVDPNCLYAGKDYENLKRFFRKLSDLQAKRRDTVRIVHYGDSLIWGDCYAKTVKRSFQKDFGDGGRGIVPPVETLATNLEDHVNRTAPEGFALHAIRHEFRYGGRFFVKPEINPMVGFTGEGAFVRGPGSEIRMEVPEGSGKLETVTLFVRAPSTGEAASACRVTIDHGAGKLSRTIVLAPGATGSLSFVIPPSHAIAMNFEGSTGPGCFVDAVNLESGRGVSYSTIVRMGIHLAWMNAVPEPALRPLRELNPDLLVFQFGINEAASLGAFREFTKEELRAQMREWLDKIKRLLPDTDVLLIGPPERLQTLQGAPAPMRETIDVQAVQREEAERAGYAYFDTYQCLGGEGQMMRMVYAGLAMSDFTHFTMRGGDSAAEGFYTAMMNAYRKKSDRPQLDLAMKETRPIRFNSASYAWFLGCMILIGLALRTRPAARLAFLAAGSYFYYATWQVWPLACLAATTAVDFTMGRLIQQARDRGGRGTPFLIGSLVFDLGLLFALKYFDFFSDLAGRMINALGGQVSVPILNLLLPVGISFYTFQSLSYTIDVWRGRITAERSPVRYAQYLSMFTQLLAGPIVKAREYLPALRERAGHFIADNGHFAAAVFLILCGLAKKTGADWLAGTIVDRVYESPQMFLPLETLAAVYAYGIQIYGDFSGYTDIAIGSAMLLGFNLTQNFRRPYASASLSEFWQRWHMSLGSWLGDYLYISLGGNRKRVLFNIGVTMLLCGLWHGAGVPFMLWGLYHGFFMVIERKFGLNRRETKNRFLRGLRVFATLHVVLFGWIIFRCGTWETFTGVLGSLFSAGNGAPNVGPLLLAVMAGFYALHFTPVSWKERLGSAWASLSAPLQAITASCVTVLLYNAATAGIRPFIYFQF